MQSNVTPADLTGLLLPSPYPHPIPTSYPNPAQGISQAPILSFASSIPSLNPSLNPSSIPAAGLLGTTTGQDYPSLNPSSIPAVMSCHNHNPYCVHDPSSIPAATIPLPLSAVPDAQCYSPLILCHTLPYLSCFTRHFEGVTELQLQP